MSDATRYAFKYVNGHPKNTRNALPTVMAFPAFLPMSTPVCRCCCPEMTPHHRTAHRRRLAMAARALARKGSRVMAIIGNGARASFRRWHSPSCSALRNFVCSTSTAPPPQNSRFANLATQGLPPHASGVAEAVLGADIVTTITADKTNATIVTADMIAPGMHINAVGGDCPGKTELHADVLASARVFVEYEPQTRIEGDIQQMPADFAVTELWRCALGLCSRPYRQRRVTVFDSVGFCGGGLFGVALPGCWLKPLALGKRCHSLPIRTTQNLFARCSQRTRRMPLTHTRTDQLLPE